MTHIPGKLWICLSGAVLSVACQPRNAAAPHKEVSESTIADNSPCTRQFAAEEPLLVAAGAGFRGPWRMNESRFHYVDDPAVAIADNGQIAVAWVNNQQQDIFFQGFALQGDTQLAEAVNVSRSPKIFSWLPRLVTNPRNHNEIFILWQEIVFSGGSHGGEIFFSYSTNGGKQFAPAINLSNTPAGAGKGRLTPDRWSNGSLDLLLAEDGTLVAAWTEYEGPLRVSISNDGGRSFSEPVHVAGSAQQPTRAPSLTYGANGVVYLAWTVGDDPAANIHIARSDDGGRRFAAPEIIAPSDGHADAPKIAVDERGALHLVYAESPQGRQQRYHIRYTRREAEQQRFHEPRTLSDGATPRGEVGAHYPSLAVAGATLAIAWEHYPDFRQRPRGLQIMFTTDGGKTFSPPHLMAELDPSPGINGGLQGLLLAKLAVNQAGQFAVVQSHFTPGKSSEVWLLRGRVDGDTGGAFCAPRPPR